MRRAALVVLTLALAHEARRSDCGYRTCTACYKKGGDKCGWCSKSNKCVVVAETDCSDYAPSSCVCDYAYKKMFPGKTMGSDGPCLQAFSHNFAAGTCSASNTACIDAAKNMVTACMDSPVPDIPKNNPTKGTMFDHARKKMIEKGFKSAGCPLHAKKVPVAAVAKKAPVKKKTAAVGNFMPVKMSNIFAPLKKGTASSVPKPKPKPLAHPDQEYDHPPQWLLDGLAGPPKDGGFVMHPEVTGKCDSTPKMKCPVTSVSKAQTACNADPKCKFFTFTGPHGLRQGSSAYPMPNCAVMCETIPSDGSWLTQTWKAGDAMKYKGWATGVRKKNLHSFPAVVEVAETPSPTPVPQFKPGTKVANFMPVNPGAIGNILKDDHSMFKAPEVTLGGDLKPTKQPTSQLAAVAATSKTAPAAAAAAAAASTSAATIAAATLRGGKGKKSSDTSGGDKSGSGCISYCKPMCLPGCIKSNQWRKPPPSRTYTSPMAAANKQAQSDAKYKHQLAQAKIDMKDRAKNMAKTSKKEYQAIIIGAGFLALIVVAWIGQKLEALDQEAEDMSERTPLSLNVSPPSTDDSSGRRKKRKQRGMRKLQNLDPCLSTMPSATNMQMDDFNDHSAPIVA